MSWRRILVRHEAALVALVGLAVLAGSFESKFFLDGRYLLDASTLYAETGILALGMALVIVAGQIDLSVAAMLALVAVVVARLMEAGWSPWGASVAGLLLGTGLGLLNGLFVAVARMPSFMVTLATLALYRGVAHAMLGARSVRIPSRFTGVDMHGLGGTPIPQSLGILALAAVAVALVLHRTVFGRWIYAVGTNEEAAHYSGVPTRAVKLWVFALSGALAAVAALHIDSRLGVARYDHANGLEVDVITAVVLGGVSILGGKGTILGVMLALVLVGLLRTGMGLANVPAEYQLAAVGTLLVFTVGVSNLAERSGARRVSRPGL